MKKTVKGGKMNPVFPPSEDEFKDLAPIVFNIPSTYNNKVKIHDWQMHTLAEPLDNTDIFPPNGSLHKSSYRRLGPGDARTGISTTQAMLSQIELKDEYQPIYPQRSLRNMRSLAADQEEEEKEPKLTDILLDPLEAACMDYRTTMAVDYKLHFPIKTKPVPPPPPVPWLLNRRMLGYSLDQLERRNGMNTFLDDNMELHQRIADLKMRRKTLNETILKENPPPNFNPVPAARENLNELCH